MAQSVVAPMGLATPEPRLVRVVFGVGCLLEGRGFDDKVGQKIGGAADLKAAVEKVERERPLLLRVRRGDATLFVALPVPKR